MNDIAENEKLFEGLEKIQDYDLAIKTCNDIGVEDATGVYVGEDELVVFMTLEDESIIVMFSVGDDYVFHIHVKEEDENHAEITRKLLYMRENMKPLEEPNVKTYEFSFTISPASIINFVLTTGLGILIIYYALKLILR